MISSTLFPFVLSHKSFSVAFLYKSDISLQLTFPFSESGESVRGPIEKDGWENLTNQGIKFIDCGFLFLKFHVDDLDFIKEYQHELRACFYIKAFRALNGREPSEGKLGSAKILRVFYNSRLTFSFLLTVMRGWFSGILFCMYYAFNKDNYFYFDDDNLCLKITTDDDKSSISY